MQQKQDGRWRVKLETRDGGFVAVALTLPMTPPPEVLIWGDRVFQIHEEDTSGDIYRECFAVAVLEVER